MSKPSNEYISLSHKIKNDLIIEINNINSDKYYFKEDKTGKNLIISFHMLITILSRKVDRNNEIWFDVSWLLKACYQESLGVEFMPKIDKKSFFETINNFRENKEEIFDILF